MWVAYAPRTSQPEHTRCHSCGRPIPTRLSKIMGNRAKSTQGTVGTATAIPKAIPNTATASACCKKHTHAIQSKDLYPEHNKRCAQAHGSSHRPVGPSPHSRCTEQCVRLGNGPMWPPTITTDNPIPTEGALSADPPNNRPGAHPIQKTLWGPAPCRPHIRYSNVPGPLTNA